MFFSKVCIIITILSNCEDSVSSIFIVLPKIILKKTISGLLSDFLKLHSVNGVFLSQPIKCLFRFHKWKLRFVSGCPKKTIGVWHISLDPLSSFCLINSIYLHDAPNSERALFRGTRWCWKVMLSNDTNMYQQYGGNWISQKRLFCRSGFNWLIVK